MAEIGRCGGCAFWLENSANSHEGECRRFPPVWEKTSDASPRWRKGIWPMTSNDDGCGEFQTKA